MTSMRKWKVSPDAEKRSRRRGVTISINQVRTKWPIMRPWKVSPEVEKMSRKTNYKVHKYVSKWPIMRPWKVSPEVEKRRGRRVVTIK